METRRRPTKCGCCHFRMALHSDDQAKTTGEGDSEKRVVPVRREVWHEATWNVRIDCFKSMALYYATTEFSSNIVVGRGTAHWILRDWSYQRFCVANLNTQTEQLSFTKVPFSLSFVPRYYQRSRRPLVHALADGEALSLLRMKETGPLIETWRQEVDQQNVGAGTSDWLCTRTIMLALTVQVSNLSRRL
jgi:hypothetical protein